MLCENPDPFWISGEDVEKTPTNWLWLPYIAAENITIIAGMGNEGKGLICTHLAACVSTGRAFPFFPEKRPAANVVWCETEDDLGSTIRPRLEAAGADLSKITLLEYEKLLEMKEAKTEGFLSRIIALKQPRLVVLSPMNSFLGSININSEIEVRKSLGKLRSLVKGTDCAIVGIAHANKKNDLQALERVSGSIAFVNFCRAVLLVTADKDSDDPQTRRLIHGKWNSIKKGPDLLYTSYYVGDDPQERDQAVRLRWEQPNEDIDHKKAFADGAFIPAAGTTKAPQWLEKTLEKSAISISELKELAKKAGLKWRAIEVARQRINEKNEAFSITSTNGVWTLKRTPH